MLAHFVLLDGRTWPLWFTILVLLPPALFAIYNIRKI